MSKSGRKLIEAATEMLAVARGEAAPARLYIDARARHSALMKRMLRDIADGKFNTKVVRTKIRWPLAPYRENSGFSPEAKRP